MNKCLTLLPLVAALALGFRLGAPRREQLRRLDADRAALLVGIDHYRLRDSLSAASVAVLTLKANELELHFEELAALVSEMNLKARRVESIAQAATETALDFAAPIQDTSVYFDDGHIRLEGVIADSEFRGSIRSVDTLTQAVHRVPRRFLFIRYGTKALRQEIVSSNPHSQITYSRYIRVER